MEKTYYARRYDSAVWWERFALQFRPFVTHESVEGFVIYKTLFNRLYVFASGYYYRPEPPPSDSGFTRPWSN